MKGCCEVIGDDDKPRMTFSDGRPMWYYRDGTPLFDIDEAERLLTNPDYVIVDKTEVKGHVVSTVWLGADYNVLGDFPIIFETGVFGPDGEFTDVYGRASTEAHALAMHQRAVADIESRGPE
jgi:hypothetical protein